VTHCGMMLGWWSLAGGTEATDISPENTGLRIHCKEYQW
jgi:hypothetical protein